MIPQQNYNTILQVIQVCSVNYTTHSTLVLSLRV